MIMTLKDKRISTGVSSVIIYDLLEDKAQDRKNEK